MSSNLKVNSLVPATGTAIGIGTTGGTIDFRCPATFGGNVTIGGTLTYDEVINIDSIGIVTARSGLKVTGGQLDVGSNIKLGNAGVVTATTFVGALTGNVTGNVSGSSGSATGNAGGLTGTPNISCGTIAGSTGTFTGDVDIADKIVHTGDTNTTIRFPSADTITAETGGSERLRIDSNGNIRLGPGGNNTNSTNYTTLTISNTAGGVVEFLDSGNNNIAGDLIGAEGSGMYLSSKQDTPIIFRTGASNSEKVRISSDGKVGVGGAPSGWQAANTSKVIQIGNASIFNYNDAYFHVGQNFYYDGSNYKYVANGFSSRLIQNAGEFTFIQAASGSANANITWSDRLKIDTTGRITQNGTTSADTASALTLKNGQSGNDHTILELISDPNQYSMIYMGASDDRYKGRIRYKDNDHFMDFYTNNEERMKLYSNGKVGINTDSTAVDAQVYIGADPGIPALYSAYGMRIMPNGDHNKRISNATGIYALTAGITGNNNWFTVAIGRYHAGTCTMRVGDASSKRSIFFNYDLTAPNYGVAHLNIIANNGAWNTGSADVQLTSSGSYDYAIQVRHNSHYNSNNNSGVYMIFNVA